MAIIWYNNHDVLVTTDCRIPELDAGIRNVSQDMKHWT